MTVSTTMFALSTAMAAATVIALWGHQRSFAHLSARCANEVVADATPTARDVNRYFGMPEGTRVSFNASLAYLEHQELECMRRRAFDER